MATINPYAGDVIHFPEGTPASVISSYYNAVLRNQALAAQQDPWYVRGINQFTTGVLNPYLNTWLQQPFKEDLITHQTNEEIRQQQERIAALYNDYTARKQFDFDYANRGLSQEGEMQAALSNILNTPGPGTTTEYQIGGGPTPYGPYDDGTTWTPPTNFVEERTPPVAEVVQPPLAENRAEGRPALDTSAAAPVDETPIEAVTPATGGANIFTATPGQKPNMAEAIRLLSANPLNAGLAMKYYGANRLADWIDPANTKRQLEEAKRQEIISKILERQALLPGRVGNQSSLDDLRVAQASRLDLSTQTEEQKEQLRQAIITMIDAGVPMEKINQYLGALKGSPVAPGAEPKRTDTLAFTQQYNTLKLQHPEWSELQLREAAQQKVMDISATQAGRNAEAGARGRVEGTWGYQRPSPTEQKRYTDTHQAVQMLAEMNDLSGRVDLKKIMGGLNPWLNQIAATKRVGPFPVPESFAGTLTDDEAKLLTLIGNYADTELRVRSGAQINEREYARLRSFLPTEDTSPAIFRTRIKTEFGNIDRRLDTINKNWQQMGLIKPDVLMREQAARRYLQGAGKAWNQAAIYRFLELNPDFSGDD